VIFAHLIQSASNLPSNLSALESAVSALERDIKILDSRSVPWEHSLPWFTAVVAIGVIMELWVIRHERRDDMETWALAHFGVLRSPSRPSTGKLLVEVASVLLITGGIVGELWIGIEIASINGALRGKSSELRGKSDLLVALLGQQTAQLESANLELKALIQPRDLSVDQRKGIGDELKTFVGRFVIIQVYAFDQEALRLATLIKAALNSGNVDAEVFANPSPGIANLPIGVRITGGNQIFVDRLKKVLSDTGKLTLTDPKWEPQITAGVRLAVVSQKTPEAIIFVGAKPFAGQIVPSTRPKKGEELRPFSQTIEIFNAK
jgi:hypothetical protein